MWKFFDFVRFRGGLVRRLALSVVLFSSLITLITTGLQLYSDFNKDLESIEQLMEQIKNSYVDSLTKSVWVVDEEQINIQLAGILQLSNIIYSQISVDNRIKWKAGTLGRQRTYSREFPLVYRYKGNNLTVGSFLAVASLEEIYQRLTDRVFVILLSNAAKTFLVVGFIFVLFQYLITRHLNRLAQYARHLDIDRLGPPLELDRKFNTPHKPDELDQVVGAFNEMRGNLEQSYSALRNSEARVRDFAEVAADWFWEMDENLTFSYLSKRFSEVTGIDTKDVIGETRWEVSNDTADTELWERHRANLERHLPFRDFHYSLLDRNANPLHLSLSGKPVFSSEGRFLGYRGTATDVTDRVDAEAALRKAHAELERRVEERTHELKNEVIKHERTEDALQKASERAETANRIKSEFLANMSHELRTPLNAIIGFSDTMKNQVFGKLANDHYEEYVENIHDSGIHLLELINDILDVSAVEAGKLELQEEALDVTKVIDSCLRLVKPRADMGKITLKTSPDDSLPMLFGDKRRLKQIMLNLLSNAVKFTPENGQVSVETRINGKGFLSIAVKDTGIGIAAEDIPKAMMPFGQIDSGLARRHEGTGLGLHLCQNLIEVHGGVLKLESEPGQGTTVTALFPKERLMQSLTMTT